MERNKKIHPLFLLIALHVCDPAATFSKESCPSLEDKNLTCYTDYRQTISCVWNSTYVSDTVCTLHAKRLNIDDEDSGFCKLEPVDIHRPMMKKCSMVFKFKWIFQSFQMLNIDLTCTDGKQNLSFLYKPACHIKLNPPPVPTINFTTISWLPQVSEHKKITEYSTQLQWRHMNQSWRDYPFHKICETQCTANLNPDDLIEGEMYQARVRVKENKYVSTWSDWSPTVSWVSLTGRPKSSPSPPPSPPPPPPLGIVGGVLGTIGCTIMLAFLFIILRLTDKTWIYIVKTIRGPPLPNPGKSSLKNVTFQSPHFTKESFHSFLNPVEIVPVEVTSTLDGVAPCGLEATLLEKKRNEGSHDSTSSSFTNPIYSQLSPPALVSTFTVGNLEACAIDTPYGPVGCQCEDKNAEQNMSEVRGKEVEILQLFSKCSNSSEPMPVVSDYEKAEKLQVERIRLQSLDSGVCSGEEVSQESLEVDSINVTDCNDEGPELKKDKDGGNGKEVDFQKLFGSTGPIFDSGSIQVCSGYEQVQKVPTDSPELPSLDSGISSGGEEQVSQESLEDVDKSTESTSLLFPPPPAPFSMACSLSSFTPLPFNFFGAGLGPAQSHSILERMALMSTNRPVEPSGDGYMPARQQHS